MPQSEPEAPWARFSIRYTVGAVTCFNQFYYSCEFIGNPPVLTDMQNAMAAWRGNVESVLLEALASDVEILEWGLLARSANHLTELFEVGGQVGTRDGEALPAQNTIVLGWQFGNQTGGSRIARGKSNISGVSEADVQFGRLDDVPYTKFVALAEGILTPVGMFGGPGAFFIWRPAYAARGLVNDFAVRDVCKVLRHRRPLS